MAHQRRRARKKQESTVGQIFVAILLLYMIVTALLSGIH